MVALVYLITIASLVVVLGTRARLRGGSPWLTMHTAFGLVGFVIWMTFLVAPESSKAGNAVVGIVGLGCWWVVSVVGMLLIQAAKPGGGRRVTRARSAGGHATAWLVHVAMLVAWVFCTWAYAVKKV